ncbi:MAG: hypothetical protein QM695_16005 [Micropruina sp.]
MSKLSKLLNERKPPEWSALEVGRRAEKNGYNLRPATVTGLFGDRHAKRPDDSTLEALTSVLPVTMEELRDALDLDPDPGEPWEPPDEARHLSVDQRRALAQLIKTMVPDERSSDGRQPDAEKMTDPEPPGLRSLQEFKNRRLTDDGLPEELKAADPRGKTVDQDDDNP